MWVPVLDTLAAAGLGDKVAELVNRLTRRVDAGRGARARLYLADGDRRLAAADTLAAAARYRAVQAIAADSVESRAAALRILRVELRSVRSSEDLALFRPTLDRTIALGGDPSREAAALLQLLNLADTLLTAEGPRDAFWFYRAELLRDSIGATALAADAFAEMAERFPDSPWTPKALIAAMAAGHPEPDRIEALLAGRYAASPYARVMSPEPEVQAEYRILEDSLHTVLATGPLASRVTVPGVALPDPGARPVGPQQQQQQPRPAGGRRTVEP